MKRFLPTEFHRKDGTINLEKAINAGHEARSEALKEVAAEIRSWMSAVRTAFMTGA